MTIEEIFALPDFAAMKKELTTKVTPNVTNEVLIKQYDPLKHNVFDEALRPKKMVSKATANKGADGKTIYATSQEEVVRIAIPFQKIIVERGIGFLLGNPIELFPAGGDDSEQEKKLIGMVERIWAKNKLDYRNKDVARKMFSECEVAELWYLVPAEEGYWGELSAGKFKPKMKILAESLGDLLYPYFDGTGDMLAFSREYVITNAGKKETHFDIYTDLKTIKCTTIEGVTTTEEIANQLKKIPVVYYKQNESDWHDVQPMIERLETGVSNRGDSNDYSGAPITVVEGELQGFASKGEQGKVLVVDKGGSVKYLESTNAGESVKLEWDVLREFIYSMTQTPDISFSQMKGLGAISGIALKLMFLDAHMKARTKEGTFGEGIQRRINLLIAMIANVIETSLAQAAIKLDLVPVFTPYLPVNEKEEVDIISVAKTGGFMATETAIRRNPLVSNPDAELELIKADSVQSISGSAI